MFRSFFPSPVNFLVSGIAWTAICMAIWFGGLGTILEPYLSLGPWLGQPTIDPANVPFLDTHKVWLYEFVLVSGYLFAIPWLIWNDNPRWRWWAVLGTVTIVEVVYFNVQVSAWLNNWYNGFYDLIQRALGAPNTVPLEDYMGEIWSAATVIVASTIFAVVNAFFLGHYLFRWRRAMTFYYMANWQTVRTVEGAAQRIQEDTDNFSSIVENIGDSIVGSVMTLLVFVPILWGLSEKIPAYPWVGAVPGGLVWLAIGGAIFGTVLFAVAGVRLPGLQFAKQRVEAAFRKELVYGEDDARRAQPVTIRELFRNVQRNVFRIFWNYTYFNFFRYVFIYGSQFFPYLAMGPAVVTGAITFGIFNQVLDAFGRVFDSFSFLMNSWTTIINLISIVQRLRGFERNFSKGGQLFANDYDDPRYLATETVPVEQTPVVMPE